MYLWSPYNYHLFYVCIAVGVFLCCVLEAFILLVRQIQPVLLGSYTIANGNSSVPVVSHAQGAVGQDQDDSHNIADNHCHCPSRIRWRLVCLKRLRPNDVAGCPGYVEPSIQEYSANVSPYSS